MSSKWLICYILVSIVQDTLRTALTKLSTLAGISPSSEMMNCSMRISLDGLSIVKSMFRI